MNEDFNIDNLSFNKIKLLEEFIKEGINNKEIERIWQEEQIIRNKRNNRSL
ncbi:hypothetical protein [Lyticum sinuosum]|uniref:Uncharacterized protein n=1 Tax=Lyticum sinuosum TaxID=1332059 RepID=A0AAE4VMH3_9RICK|nr:hypothetical protein [Lyticum sinuosum]MDZ5761544.1 hypothetical protein [Lyticum sinuosum]